MVQRTAEYLNQHSLRCMVLGVSGGIDSTLTACVCYEVAKQTNIPLIGVSLPCSSNSDDENASANLTLEAFCDEHWVENLQKEYMLMKATCERHVASTDISQGNIKARLRMIYLYNIASVKGGVVMDTDNITEHELGFWTLHGDSFDINPIGCLWKHEIFELVQWLYENRYNDEETVQCKALKAAHEMIPTDGNGVKAGGDLAQIAPNSTFEEVDEILNEYLTYGGCSEKHPKDTVSMVIARHLKSEYKRQQMPIKMSRLFGG